MRNERGGAAAWVLIGLGSIAAVAALFVLVYGIRWVTAPATGKLQQRETVQSGPNRTAAYEYFFNLCSAIQTDELRILDQMSLLPGEPDAQRQSQIRANIAALRSSRSEKANQYNVDAAKETTIGQFRSWQLPPRINPTVAFTEDGFIQEATTCV